MSIHIQSYICVYISVYTYVCVCFSAHSPKYFSSLVQNYFPPNIYKNTNKLLIGF